MERRIVAETVEFRLATVSIAGCPPFPSLVLEERAYALRAVSEFVRGTHGPIEGHASMLEMLAGWPANLPRLQAAAAAIASGDAPQLTGRGAAVEALRFHAPVTFPGQVYCSGANYKRHVVQLIIALGYEAADKSPEERRAYGQKLMDERAAHGTPYFFLKAQSSITGPFDPVTLPPEAQQPDWELELAVVMGRPAHRVTRAQALDYIAGYTIANDITTRERVFRRAGDMREMGTDWVAAKSASSYLPLGPYLVPAFMVADPQRLQITLKLNGEIRQDESTEDMIFDVARLIEDLSNKVTLLPGDVICTGSPAGNGAHYGRFLKPGDVLEGSISGMGTQRNACVAENV
jgi:2-keto-4-pentenoate hydratase/2-oxohepta-3-ene-1,7-dioic acid hydratase in catechol pathway